MILFFLFFNEYDATEKIFFQAKFNKTREKVYSCFDM